MEFSVKTEALRTYRTALQSWSHDTATATSYVAAHTDVEWSDAMMFQPVVQVNEKVVKALDAALSRIRQVTAASAQEIAAAAVLYDSTDAHEAQRSDSLYEAVTTAPGQEYKKNAAPSTDTKPEKPADE